MVPIGHDIVPDLEAAAADLGRAGVVSGGGNGRVGAYRYMIKRLPGQSIEEWQDYQTINYFD